MSRATLFVGIPTWNSADFLDACIRQIKRTCWGIRYEIGVLDNESTDASADIARLHNCRFERKRLSLPDALNRLASWSKAEYTLLIHADTILLSPHWFIHCIDRLRDETVMLSPQDIGCGPFSRPWGKGQPESSFMLFRTSALRVLRNTRWVRRVFIRVPQRVVNFYSPNVTHYLPEELKRRGLAWRAMTVHTSRHLSVSIYEPGPDTKCWSPELGYLEYGLGNFYSLDGLTTHYHNWYERILGNESNSTRLDYCGIPLDYIKQRTVKFLSDLAADAVAIPEVLEAEREPVAIPFV